MKALAPKPPAFEIDHEALHQALPLAAQDDCVLNPDHHGEGMAIHHTIMALEELVKLPAWRALDEPTRETVFLATALHNVGKPLVTKVEDGKVIDHGHWHVSEHMTRELLYRAGFAAARREEVAGLVRWHQAPLLLDSMPDPQRVVFQLSYDVRCRLLAILAEACSRGRVCADLPRRLAGIAHFVELCEEHSCLDGPRAFANDHSRVEYFRQPARNPHYAAYDDTRFEVVMLAGLPGAGKDTWLTKHAKGLPVVSLDDIREGFDLDRGETPGEVITTARERVREHLRVQQPFVFNATNARRDLRRMWLDLFLDYHARVRIVALEAPWVELVRRSKSRAHPVPLKVLERFVAKWQPPSAIEAHVLERVS